MLSMEGTEIMTANVALPPTPRALAVMTPAAKLITVASNRVASVPPIAAGLTPGSRARRLLVIDSTGERPPGSRVGSVLLGAADVLADSAGRQAGRQAQCSGINS
ncbi:hypothetical protein PYK79_23785 [Streptomyces sp. ID05-04B]|uniref:hypothetical protein n=1 Tax=Streptomyces sp. ID05-04B TaxID=3028661 RepID=UPI0029C2B7B2|nr:hypothetical protein [Streptomyces sp. ID05-04B]MDX5565726.1 hypothetical protein [Streptomyces sp. ID05-04B]